MRAALRHQAYVCIECRLRQVQKAGRRYQSDLSESQSASKPIDLSTSIGHRPTRPLTSAPVRRIAPKIKRTDKDSLQNGRSAIASDHVDAKATASSQTQTQGKSDDGVKLSRDGNSHAKAVKEFLQKLRPGMTVEKPTEPAVGGVSFEEAVQNTDIESVESLPTRVPKRLKRAPRRVYVSNDTVNLDGVPEPVRNKDILLKQLGIGPGAKRPLLRRVRGRKRVASVGIAGKRARLLARPQPKRPHTEAEESSLGKADLKESKRSVPRLEGANLKTLSGDDVTTEPLLLENPQVPRLSFNLSRVLFNPGVYQLQDPRSRVFNFSPYLQRLLPVSEFNFDVLNQYITSSRDPELRDLGLRHGKKYLGSSSSLSGALVHFHFLLSAWRPINVKTLSQSFTDSLRSFTKYQRGPNAIFLRWRDGIYAVDADKKYDSSNILMDMGRSMEKLLTLEEAEFERYRKKEDWENTEPPRPDPEAYHYTRAGDFLLRSQLDAFDPRLPGTGMFDLKTRAVVSIRMNVRRPEDGMGYEIRNRFGDEESYEKEYFDMIRSAFLKYSLQVRMGRMDGIFVAYHNIERIFGFQYISQPEMDLHLHGTEDRTIGDGEFKFSLGLLNRIFDHVTTKMPQKSIRFHFETRDSISTEGSFMYIFAEAQSEEEIDKIQNSGTADMVDFGASIETAPHVPAEDPAKAFDERSSEPKTESENEFVDQEQSRGEESPLAERSEPAEPKAATKFGDLSQPGQNQLIGLVLRVRNRVNGEFVVRPNKLDQYDSWNIEYTLEELSHDRALTIYNQCRTRRKLLQSDWQKEDVANYYLRKMKRLAQNGRHVRKDLDRNDAGRPVVVLDEVQ